MKETNETIHRHLGSVKAGAISFARFFLSPSRAVREPSKRRQARLLSLFLLTMFLIFLGINITYALTIPGYRLPIPDLIGYVVLLATYLLSRTRYFGVAKIIMLLMFPMNVFGNILSGTTSNVISTLSFLLPCFILASIFLSEIGVAIVGVAINVGIALLPLLAPQTFSGFVAIVGVLSSSFLTVTLLVISMIHRDKLEHDRQLEMRETYDRTLEGWSRALEVRDKETEGHSKRVTELTMKLARACGIKGEDLKHIYRGALLHDVGKIAIPDAILGKPGPLNEAEWAVMHTHPAIAVELLASIPFLFYALDIPAYHHERWDGSGYPSGLSGEQIPLSARIFAVVDVWDAVLSNRPYRKAWSEAEAIKYLQDQSGKQFDPWVLEKFLKILEKRKQAAPA